MGGDAASVESRCYYIRQTLEPKVFKNGPYLIGYTSSFRMGHLLQYKADLPAPPKEGDLMKFMSTTFMDYTRDLFKYNGYSKINDNQEEGGTYIVAFQGEIFEIDDDFHAQQWMQPYASVGCGREYALGVCHALYDIESPEDIITKALEAAEMFSTGVTRPFTIMKA
jgi:hypothetical protein